MSSLREHVVIDLETMGTGSNAAIIQIGAVLFNEEEKLSYFAMNVDLASSVESGMEIEPGTVKWWMEADATARKLVMERGVRLSAALTQFSSWIVEARRAEGDVMVWGNGATFDNVIMSSAYKAIGLGRPWGHLQDRCYRTVKSAPWVRSAVESGQLKMPEFKGVKHNALDDAVHQAEVLIEINKIATVL